jgi:predicted transcriptional regulator
MTTKGKPGDTKLQKLVRTSVLVPAETDAALRLLAEKGKRPLSWEIRQALEAHVKAEVAEAA